MTSLPKIAIIGCNSFLAKHLTMTFKDKYEVIGYGRRPDSQLSKFCEFEYPNVSIKFDELLEASAIFLTVGAGVQSKDDSSDLFLINTFFPIELMLFLERNNYKGIVFTFGSYFEIGSSMKQQPYTENEIIKTMNKVSNNYCISKRLLTKFISSSNLSLSFYHLILPTIYGKYENERRLLPYLVKSMMSNSDIVVSSGEQVRQYVYIEDVCKIISLLMLAVSESGVYNVPEAETIKIKDLVLMVANKYKYPSSKITFGLQQKHDEEMKYLVLDSIKLQSKINFKPQNLIVNNLYIYE